jgi:N-methylhydantoinase A
MRFRVGVDSGGTFTDLLVVDDRGGRHLHKIISTPDDPARAVVHGLAEIAASMNIGRRRFFASIDTIVHGTTVTTNCLITRSGATAGLLCTEGFRDTLPLRDGRREEPYNNKLPVPTPLVSRYLRVGIPGRIDHTGRELIPLDETAVRHAASIFRREHVESVTIALLHSWVNDEHEQRAAQIIRRLLPDVYLTVSSELLSQVGLFDRTSTAVLNSYVAPVIARYMDSLRSRLSDEGFHGILRLTQSNGGVATPEALVGRAVASLLSGPAAGPAAGIQAVAPLGRRDCITVDMGGTSFDAAIVQDGIPLVMTDGWVDRWRLALPMLDIHTVGAGGGSVAMVNAGLLRVGPFSAGADPGPACYGRGGGYATVTDADLILGYIGASMLGGAITLDRDAAIDAVRREVAQPLGISVTEAAAGIYEVVNVSMAEAVREVSINRGWDPREFPLVVAGGAGPVHAAAIAEEMGIPVLVIPRESAIFCAGGMLLTDFKHDYVRSLRGLLHQVPAGEFAKRWAEMADEGRAVLSAEGIANDAVQLTPLADLRYRGQWHELTLEVPASQMHAPDIDSLTQRFHELHDSFFGYHTVEMPIEVINVRLVASGRTAHAVPNRASAIAKWAGAAPYGKRAAWSRREHVMTAFALYAGEKLRPGNYLAGPALVELATTTVVVPESFGVFVDRQGSFVMAAQPHWPAVRRALAGGPLEG